MATSCMPPVNPLWIVRVPSGAVNHGPCRPGGVDHHVHPLLITES